MVDLAKTYTPIFNILGKPLKKMVVGRLLSFWKGLVLGASCQISGVYIFSMVATWTSTWMSLERING